MQLLRQVIAGCVAFLVALAAESETCEVDLGGPVMPAYFCAERLAQAARAQVKAELEATVAAVPRKLRPGGPSVSRNQLRAAQAAWVSYAQTHCALSSQVPGEPGDWHIRVIYENVCLAHESGMRIAQLQKWRACFKEGGGICLP